MRPDQVQDLLPAAQSEVEHKKLCDDEIEKHKPKFTELDHRHAEILNRIELIEQAYLDISRIETRTVVLEKSYNQDGEEINELSVEINGFDQFGNSSNHSSKKSYYHELIFRLKDSTTGHTSVVSTESTNMDSDQFPNFCSRTIHHPPYGHNLDRITEWVEGYLPEVEEKIVALEATLDWVVDVISNEELNSELVTLKLARVEKQRQLEQANLAPQETKKKRFLRRS